MDLTKYSPGFYLATAPLFGGLIQHTGVIDIGNRMGYPTVYPGCEPVVIHLPFAGLRAEGIRATKLNWTIGNKLSDDELVRSRIAEAAKTPVYRFFDNNCEHFTEFVRTGVRSSPQLQGAGVAIGVILLIGAMASSTRPSRGTH